MFKNTSKIDSVFKNTSKINSVLVEEITSIIKEKSKDKVRKFKESNEYKEFRTNLAKEDSVFNTLLTALLTLVSNPKVIADEYRAIDNLQYTVNRYAEAKLEERLEEVNLSYSNIYNKVLRKVQLYGNRTAKRKINEIVQEILAD